MEEKIIHNDYFNIDVKQYLGYDEIQKIIETTLVRDNFADRQKNIDMLLLHYAAGFSLEELQNSDPDVYLKSGLVDYIKCINMNWQDVQKGIDYYMSTNRLLGSLIAEIQKLPQSPEFKNIIENGIQNRS